MIETYLKYEIENIFEDIIDVLAVRNIENINKRDCSVFILKYFVAIKGLCVLGRG